MSEHDEKFLKKLIGGIEGEEEETPEQAAKREAEAAKWKADQEKRQREYEESIRLAVPRTIEKLRKDAAAQLAEADQLEALLKQYPNLRKHTGRWNKVAYYTKDVNALVTDYDLRHNCGCCKDSPLEIWPYIMTPLGKVYSDPSEFRVGEREPFYGGDVPYKGWDTKMRDAGIPEEIIKRVGYHFREEAEEAREAAERIYGGERDPNDDEPAV